MLGSQQGVCTQGLVEEARVPQGASGLAGADVETQKS